MLRVSRRVLEVSYSQSSRSLHRVREQWRWLTGALALTVLIVGIAILIVATTGTEWRQLTSDPNALGGDPWYFGFMEVATSLILAAAAGVALFSATLVSGNAKRFFLWAGFFTLLLSLDDIYMLHETISERSIYVLYGAYVLALFAFNRDYLWRTPGILAAVAVSFLGLAVIADTANDWDYIELKGTEEVLELFALCLWSTYLVSCSRQALEAR